MNICPASRRQQRVSCFNAKVSISVNEVHRNEKGDKYGNGYDY